MSGQRNAAVVGSLTDTLRLLGMQGGLAEEAAPIAEEAAPLAKEAIAIATTSVHPNPKTN